jgi:hypothetical protein
MERVQKRWCARCLGLFRSIGPGGETVGEIRAMITDSQPHRSIGLKSKKKCKYRKESYYFRTKV